MVSALGTRLTPCFRQVQLTVANLQLDLGGLYGHHVVTAKPNQPWESTIEHPSLEKINFLIIRPQASFQ